jgi:hypothetical protein
MAEDPGVVLSVSRLHGGNIIKRTVFRRLPLRKLLGII